MQATPLLLVADQVQDLVSVEAVQVPSVEVVEEVSELGQEVVVDLEEDSQDLELVEDFLGLERVAVHLSEVGVDLVDQVDRVAHLYQ